MSVSLPRPAAGPAPVERRPVAPRPPRRPRDIPASADDRAAIRRALLLSQGIVCAVFEQRTPDTLRGLAYELTDELRGLRDRLDPQPASGRRAQP